MASLIINHLPAPATLEWRRVGGRTAAPFSASFRKAAGTITFCSITTNAVVPKAAKKNKSPWLMLPPSLDGTQLVYDFYNLSDDRIVSFNKTSDPEFDDELPDDDATFWGSSHGWIVSYNMDKGDSKMFLSNPISHRHIKLPELPRGTQDWSDGRASVDNVIISSPDPANDLDCRVVMRYFPGELAFCCPARPNSKWILFGERETYCSLVYSARQKLFFCLAEEGFTEEDLIEEPGIEAWDLTDLSSPVMIPMNNLCLDSHQSSYPAHVNAYSDKSWFSGLRLLTSLAVAEDSDDLYQVRRFIAESMGPDGSHGKIIKFSHPADLLDKLPFNTSVHFDVYKYDKELREWKYMDPSRGLDGMAIFVGINHGFALSSKDYPHLKPDSVYFTEYEECLCPNYARSGLDLGIFNYRSKTISPCYYPRDLTSKKYVFPPPLWFTPNI